MLRLMTKAKIQNAQITDLQLYCEGSVGIDSEIMQAANLLADEMVLVVNVNNGERLETYIIAEPPGSGKICLYGPAARLAEVGDILHIISPCLMSDEEAKANQIKVIVLGEDNAIKEIR